MEMASSIQDLGSITELLIEQLTNAIMASPRYQKEPFPFEVSGLAPKVPSADDNTVVNLSLLRVDQDQNGRNAPVRGQFGQENAAQPLAVNLCYLLTCNAEENWLLEQYLMSVALGHIHANPIYADASLQFTSTVDSSSIDQMSSLWQAITIPMRLSVLLRVSAVFLDVAGPAQPDAGRVAQPVF